jgi:autotransporter-associated beta strand protein
MPPRLSRSAIIVWALVCVAYVVTAASKSHAQPARPNIVLIVSDDGGYADWGFMNQFSGQTTQFKTPRMDQLAQQSVVFSNGYVSSPLCASSRAGLLTGKYQQRFGFEWNISDGASTTDGMPASETMMSERFKQLGYTTGIVGKWHIGNDEPRQPQNQGFDESFVFLNGSNRYYANTPNAHPLYRNGVQVEWQNEASFNGTPGDSTYGRFLTDAFGDEASRFVAQHADDANPFMLYLPFNAPHYPNTHIKATDMAEFHNSTLPRLRKITASLTFGMDRNIGEVLDRLDDPNQDGNTADSIRNNTIIVFVNDNGGDKPLPDGQTYDNGVLRDYKGSHWEGGIRVPYMISAPGVAPGVVHDMVSSLDIFPTLLAAAGESTAGYDGVNLLPRLTGQQTGPVHDTLFWRMGVDGFAVRKGDWKLAKGRSNAAIELYRLNANGTGETVDLSSQNPGKLQELIRDFVGWETTVDKVKWTSAFTHNLFDEFVQRNEVLGASNPAFNWQWGGGWRNNQNPSQTARLWSYDAAPNTVLIFETRSDTSYTSLNNVQRAVSAASGVSPAGLSEFMLNEVRLRGNHTGSTARSATLSGNALMLVDNLSGRQARLGLDANRSATSDYTFNVNMDLVLYDDLLLTGSGTANFRIGGALRDFYEPRNVVKEGSSTMTFAGYNTYKGETEIREGTLRVNSSLGAIDGSSRITVKSGASLVFTEGVIKTARLSLEPGSLLTFTGGHLAANQVDGTLVNQGGTFAPSLNFGVTPLSGNFIQTGGLLNIGVGGPVQNGAFDRLAVAGSATIGGVLSITAVSPASLTLGQSFEVLTAFGGINGGFSSFTGPVLSPGLAWSVQYTPTSVLVNIVQDAGIGGPVSFLTRWKQSYGIDAGGDADGDGDTDGADFLKWQRGEAPLAVVPVSYISLWKNHYGPTNIGDLNSDGRTDGTDFLLWQRHAAASAAIAAGVQLVPEPAGATLAVCALTAIAGAARRRRVR